MIPGCQRRLEFRPKAFGVQRVGMTKLVGPKDDARHARRAG